MAAADSNSRERVWCRAGACRAGAGLVQGRGKGWMFAEDRLRLQGRGHTGGGQGGATYLFYLFYLLFKVDLDTIHARQQLRGDLAED